MVSEGQPAASRQHRLGQPLEPMCPGTILEGILEKRDSRSHEFDPVELSDGKYLTGADMKFTPNKETKDPRIEQVRTYDGDRLATTAAGSLSVY